MRKEIKVTDKLINQFIKYLQEQEKSQSTINSYKRELFSLQMYIDQYPLTKEKLIAYKAILTNQYTPSTCNVAIAAINSFLRFVGRQDLMVKPLRVQKQIFENKNRELTKKDYEKLIRAATIKGDERTALAIQTICATGIRVSELQYITVEAIKSDQAHVSNKGKNRVIFIPRALSIMLKKYVINQNITSGSVFVTRNGKPLDRTNLWKSMKKLCNIAGVNSQKVYPHNLRHLFARTYYGQQKDISRLADILGHSNINTTRIYTRESGAVHAKQIAALGLVRDTT
jgi:integrase/recombinase XerD